MDLVEQLKRDAIAMLKAPTNCWEIMQQIKATTCDIHYEVDSLVRIISYNGKRYKIRITPLESYEQEEQGIHRS